MKVAETNRLGHLYDARPFHRRGRAFSPENLGCDEKQGFVDDSSLERRREQSAAALYHHAGDAAFAEFFRELSQVDFVFLLFDFSVNARLVASLGSPMPRVGCWG